MDCGQAASSYSWMRPLRTSRRRIVPLRPTRKTVDSGGVRSRPAKVRVAGSNAVDLAARLPLQVEA